MRREASAPSGPCWPPGRDAQSAEQPIYVAKQPPPAVWRECPSGMLGRFESRPTLRMQQCPVAHQGASPVSRAVGEVLIQQLWSISGFVRIAVVGPRLRNFNSRQGGDRSLPRCARPRELGQETCTAPLRTRSSNSSRTSCKLSPKLWRTTSRKPDCPKGRLDTNCKLARMRPCARPIRGHRAPAARH